MHHSELTDQNCNTSPEYQQLIHSSPVVEICPTFVSCSELELPVKHLFVLGSMVGSNPKQKTQEF
jgi:hypothetical protein